jgi:preprotein translocase subunit Sec63
MLGMYVAEAEERGEHLLSSATIRAMDCSTSAHSRSDESVSDFEENDGVDDSDSDDDGDDGDDDDDDGGGWW